MWSGSIGVEPFDNIIEKINKVAYAHHIERLMYLGNFLFLLQIRPNDVFHAFMEWTVDAYDWVMVPNVYGMSQFSDGGSFATKPYISGSNYIKKMSNFPKGDWQEIWDGLFWRFLNLHRDTFSKNPRMSMLLKTLDRMSREKRESHFEIADRFIENLYK